MTLVGVLLGGPGLWAQAPETPRILRGWGDLGAEQVRTLDEAQARALKVRPALVPEDLTTHVRVDGEKVEKMTTLLSSDFEGSFPSNVWTSFSQGGADVSWGRSTFRSSSGSASAWCAQNGLNAPGAGADVPPNTESWMIAGPFDLSSANTGELTFDFWLETELDFDFFFVGASLNGLNFTSFGSDVSTNGWQTFALDLTNWGSLGDLTGQSQVWFTFIYDSDSSIDFEGAYVDNVSLVTDVGGGGGSGLNLLINQIDASSCPTVEAIVSVTDDQGNPITNLGGGNFTIEEDNTVQTVNVGNAGTGGSALAVTLVLDGSGSLSNSDVTNIQAASNSFIDLLTASDRIAVYHFSGSVTLVQDYTTNRNAARAAVNALNNSGSTALYDAIVDAANHSLTVGGRRALVVMTDGQDNSSSNSLQDAIDAAVSAGVPVFTIGFGSADIQVLNAIASQTGGVFFQGATSSDLQTILGLIGQTLNNQYILGWTTAVRDGGFHDVTVQVQNQGNTATQTVTYSQANTPCATGGSACVPGPNTMCLRQDRFRIQVAWTDLLGNQGLGSVASCGTDDSGLFWFFNANNWEMLVKVIDGCGFNNNYWVFLAATTNLGYEMTVTDTLTNAQQVYTNPPGAPAPAVTDTQAFATCP